MMMPCDICGKSGHAWFDCSLRKTKPVGWKPDRLKKSAASPKAKDRPSRGKALSQDSVAALSPSGPADPAGAVHARKVGASQEVGFESPAPADKLKVAQSALDGVTKRGTPRKRAPKGTGFDRKAYQREKARERRLKQKAAAPKT